jgi:hypothetical protein
MLIKTSYRTCDHFSESRSFKTVKGASAYARRRLGSCPEIGTTYAVSPCGTATLRVTGVSLRAIFPNSDVGEFDGYMPPVQTVLIWPTE